MSTGEKLLKGLAQKIRAWRSDPVAFVRDMFRIEPTPQQLELLNAIAKPGAHVSVKSGHGTGKSCSLAWITLWFVMCFEDCKIPCTAPSSHQLHDVMWAELGKWHQRMPEWIQEQVVITKDRVMAKGRETTQFAVARTSRKENPEALQGFHATNLLFIIDEASGVPDQIFEVARGALSTKGARVVMTANPTRLDGYFYKSHHALREHWNCLHFSCLESPLADQDYIDEMKLDYGEESDIYRIRVLGEFPRASVCQLIDGPLVERAQALLLRPDQYAHAPRILGVDVAWEGDDRSVVYLRQGLYTRKLGTWHGISNMDLAGLVGQYEDEYQTKATFIDVGWGTGVIDRLRQMGRSPMPVYFGGRATKTDRFQNKRTEMWVSMKEWLEAGGSLAPAAFDDKKALEDMRQDLVGPQYFFTPSGKICLESKKDMKRRGLHSPDLGDALALTFAEPVRGDIDPLGFPRRRRARPAQLASNYNPLQRSSAGVFGRL